MGMRSKGHFHSVPKQAPGGGIVTQAVTWAISTLDSTVNAGTAIQIRLTRALHNNDAVATTITLAGAPFPPPAGYATGAAFAESIDAMINELVATDPTHLTKGAGLSFIVAANWPGTTLDLTRSTVERTGQGDLFTSFTLVSVVNQGVILGSPTPVITIVDAVIVPAGPVWTIAASISGTATVGGTLTRNPGTLTGSPTPSLTWVWRKDTVDIAGTTDAATYSPVTNDLGHSITIHSVASNATATATSTSDAVVIVGTPSIPVVTRISLIQGPNPPQVGSLTHWDAFTWTGSPPPNVQSYVYANGVVVVGGNPNAYVPITGDIGKTLRRVEIADNGYIGPVTAQTVASGAVIAASGGALTNVAVAEVYSPWKKDSSTSDGADNDFICSFRPTGAITSASLVDDAGGRVKLSGTAGLLCTTVPCNFGSSDEDFVAGGPYFYHDMDMSATVLFNGTLTETYTFDPSFPAIAPTGGADIGDGNTTVVVHNLTEFRAEMNNPTTDARIIRFDPDTDYVMETNSSTHIASVNGKENWTLVGHRGVIFGRDSSLVIVNAKNFIITCCAFRPGADTAGASRQNRDCLEINYAENFRVEYCDFSWSIDELTSLIRQPNNPTPKRGVFYRCAFYEPLSFAGHSPGEPNHPYGPLAYVGTEQLLIVECTMFDMLQRAWLFQQNSSFIEQNCYVHQAGTGGGNNAIQCGSTSPTVDNNNKIMALVQGNLFTYQVRPNLICFNAVGTGGKIYIAPSTSDYANHVINLPSPTLAADPFDPATSELRNGGTLGSLVTTPPFEFAGYPCRSTKTLANRQALYDILLGEDTNLVGVREFDGDGDPLVDDPVPGWLAMTKIGYDAFKRRVETGANYRPTGGYPNPPPAAYDSSFDQVKDAYDTSLPVDVGSTPPVISVVPAISGTTTAGSILTTTSGTWTGTDPKTYTYQWYRGVTAISGATSITYQLVTADIGSTIKVTVTATNVAGSASSTSSSTAAITSGGTSGVITWGSNIPLATFGNFYNGTSGTGTRNYKEVQFIESGEAYILCNMSDFNNTAGTRRNAYVVVYNLTTGALRNAQNTVSFAAGHIITRAEMDASFKAIDSPGFALKAIKDHLGNLIVIHAPYTGARLRSVLTSGGTTWSAAAAHADTVIDRATWRLDDGRIQTVGESGSNFFIRTRATNGTWTTGATLFTKERTTLTFSTFTNSPLGMSRWPIRFRNTTAAANMLVFGEFSNIGGVSSSSTHPNAGDECNQLRGYLVDASGVIQKGANNYFASNGCTYVLSDLAAPSAIYVEETDTVWIGWEIINPGGGQTRRPSVITYHVGTDTWGTPVVFGSTGISNDDHNPAILFRDHTGRIHCFWSAHSQIFPMQHAFTTNADDSTAWTLAPNPWIASENDQTYPEPIVVGNKVYLFTRDDNTSADMRLCVTIGTVA